MQTSPKDWNFRVKSAPGTRLPSGGIYPPYGHIGHWEVTAKIAEEMGFSAPSVDILCDASQDPDFYDFETVAAHAQTPDEADLCGTDTGRRTAIIEKAQDDYLKWVHAHFQRCASGLQKGKVRFSLYWLGYALHGIEDLAVHKGITNGEHASAADNPDFEAADVALSYVYARRMLDEARSALGQDGFDRLRNHDGDGSLGPFEKRSKEIHPGGWDIDNGILDYKAAGKRYKTIKPKPNPVRWDREVVLSRVLEQIQTRRVARTKEGAAASPGYSANPHRRFEVLKPLSPRQTAKWAILVYMAGDDRNPRGIEYAISQDLMEMKQIGSTDSVHFIVQTDDATGNASYRYRLLKGTDIAADRIERFNGELNTGSTKTLVDFVKWSHHLFPAERNALVLWGHGSGHDDQDVYRTARGSVSPRTAARLAQRRLGFFSGTRRAILEQGPTRGYGYDDTSRDFLDNAELRKALLEIKEVLGRNIDILGFDACLMAMIEIAYQIRESANILVGSERTEPGDGWWYSRAFQGLPIRPETTPHELARSIVGSFKKLYKDEMTLSAIDLEQIPLLAETVRKWSTVAEAAAYHRVRRCAIDCSPRPDEGYCDLGSFLEAAADPNDKGSREAISARKALNKAVIASCGSASGLTIYAPGNFNPQKAGGKDALYMSLDFARESEWGNFLGRVYPPVPFPARVGDTLPKPTPVSALDRFNARRVLAAVRSKANEGWIDRLRGEVLGPCGDTVASLWEDLDRADSLRARLESAREAKSGPRPGKDRRILILPGIMGSLLHDRSGNLGAVWLDPWNLVFGDDFDALKLKWDAPRGSGGRGKAGVDPLPCAERIPDADVAVKIEPYGVIPLIFDRLALALMHEFGPVVEFAPYDWRQPMRYLGKGLADRIEALTRENPGMEIALVAHSMGGLVAADALTRLGGAKVSVLDAVKALVVLGTPFLGSGSALQALRGEKRELCLLNSLRHKSPREILNTVQTFRGLFDLLPANQEKLLHPAVFEPGPLSRLSPGDPRLTTPLTLERSLPESMMERTRAIVCTSRKTIGAVEVQEDGTVDYSNYVAGDGTVSANSALKGGKLMAQCIEVSEPHMTLPLDGKAIEHTVQWVRRQFGVPPSKSSVCAWPPAPEISIPQSCEDLIRRLEDEDELTLGDFAALTSMT